MTSKTETKKDMWETFINFAPVWDAMVEMKEMAELIAFTQALACPTDQEVSINKQQIVVAMDHVRKQLENWSDCLHKAITDGIIGAEKKKQADLESRVK